MKNTLKLRKCAYIFDSSYGNYFYGTKEMHAKRREIQKHMKQYYDSEELRNTPMEYSVNEYGQITITVNNELHRLNDLQIASISEAYSIINHRRVINAATVKTNNYHLLCNRFLHSNHFKTLHFEFFTGEEDLGYIRVYFKGNAERFIIDDRTGEINTSGEYGRHKPIKAKEIAKRLDITGEKARKEFFEMINIITSEEMKNEKN